MTLTQQFVTVSPEIFMSVMILVILMVDSFLSKRTSGVTYLLSQLTLIGCAIFSWRLLSHPTAMTFSGQVLLDRFGTVSQLFIDLLGFMLFIYARAYTQEHRLMRGEYYLLSLLSILGAMVLVQANSLLTLYLGLELMSLPLYALVALKRDHAIGAEAAMKYFVMGALASGLLLYGMSLLYGLAHSIQIPTIVATLQHGTGNMTLLLFSMVFVLAAICFKLGAVPFHMWVPDVYQGSPNAVTGLLGTIPKLAALALLMRLITQGFASVSMHWGAILMVLAVLSLVIGNICAIVQTNLKRMLAFSTIANVGFVLLGIAGGDHIGYAYALFYMMTYVLMAVGAFGLLTLMSRKGHDIQEISDLSGLNAKHGWLAFMMMLILLSMAGIPPLVGFDAKLFIIVHLVDLHQYAMALFALIISVVGAYYYLNVVRVMYFSKPKQHSQPVALTRDGFLTLSINGLLLLALGIYPTGLLMLCHGVF